MMTNASMTIYNRYHDKEAGLYKYKRTVIHDVFWDGVEGTSRLQSGLKDANKVLVLVPFKSLSTGKLVGPKEFIGQEGTFTFAKGDRIVKGEVNLEIESAIAELDKRFEAYTLTTIDEKDFGSYDMRHWRLGGN